MITHRLGRVVRSYVEVARSPSYFPLWLSQLVSGFGDTLHYIALVVLVYQLTGQGAAVAVLVAAEVLPVLLLGPVAGVVIDRFSRKSVLITADLARALLVLSLVWPHVVPRLSVLPKPAEKSWSDGCNDHLRFYQRDLLIFWGVAESSTLRACRPPKSN